MAISSKINIDVDASKFDALSKAMDKYKTAIETLPGTFAKAHESASDLDTKLTAIAAAMAVQAANSEKIQKSTTEF
jgi:type II secretory pathway component PulF